MPTPANALFWGSLTVGAHSFLYPILLMRHIFSFGSCVIIAGGRNPNVLIKIQESCLETEQSQLYFPHCMHPPVDFKISSFATIILWYIILSLLTKKSVNNKRGTLVVRDI